MSAPFISIKASRLIAIYSVLRYTYVVGLIVLIETLHKSKAWHLRLFRKTFLQFTINTPILGIWIKNLCMSQVPFLPAFQLWLLSLFPRE